MNQRCRTYDGDGNLSASASARGMRRLRAGGSGVYEVDKTSGGSTIRTVTYYPAAGALRVDGTLYYVLKDHLGSTSVVTDSTGNVVGEQRYYPFGETRLTTGTMLTDKLFTGQREITGLGIYHYGARFREAPPKRSGVGYSPSLGRFLSADTITPNPANPQDFNRYSYVRNSPLKYTDPTGHWVVETDDPNEEQRRNARRHNEDRERNRRERERANGGGGGGQPLPVPTPLSDDCVSDPSCFYADQGDLTNLSNYYNGMAWLEGSIGAVALGIGLAGTVSATGGGITVVLAPGPLLLAGIGLWLGAEALDAASLGSQFGGMASTLEPNESIAIHRDETFSATYYHPEGATTEFGTGPIVNRGFMELWAWAYSWDD